MNSRTLRLRLFRIAIITILVAYSAAIPAHSAELKKETAATFDRYIGASEKRMKSELDRGTLLFIDEWPMTRRTDAYTKLRKGQLLIQQANTEEEGHPIDVPHGLIHDWVGTLFIPNAKLSQVLAVVQDYDNHQHIYAPDVRESKLLSHEYDHFQVFLQLYKKSLVTVVMNATFDVTYEHPKPNLTISRSYSTKLAEVENVGQKDEQGHKHWSGGDKKEGALFYEESSGKFGLNPAK